MASATCWFGYESAATIEIRNGVPFLLRIFVGGSAAHPAASRLLAAASASYGCRLAAATEEAQAAVGIGVGSASARPASTSLTIFWRSIDWTSARRTLGSLKKALPSPSELRLTNEFVNILASCTVRSRRLCRVATSCG